MKKNLFYFAVAALALTACSSDEIANEGAENNGQVAVSFDAYSQRTTRAAVVNTDALKVQGFGVFAYEQGSIIWDTYRSSNVYPNFFYNQQVNVADVPTSYALISPISAAVYNSITNATLKGLYTLDNGEYTTSTPLATADYAALTEKTDKELCSPSATGSDWKYAPVKYFSNNIGAKHSFFAYAPYSKNVNVIFSMSNTAPVIRYTAKEDYDLLFAPAITDQEKPGVNTKLTFNFKHALSKVSFDVAPFVDEVHGAAHTASQDLTADTKITVRSVKFVGKVPSQGLMNLKDGSWTLEATEEGAYEITEPVTFDAATIVRKALINNMMVIPTKTSNSSDKVKVKVVYDVTTTDTANPKNNSTVTNTVTSTEEFELLQGKAYTFHLDLGMTTVKFTADVDNWTSGGDQNVDLPNNVLPNNVSQVAIATTPQAFQVASTNPAGGIDGDYAVWNNELWKNTSGTWAKDAAYNGNIYVAPTLYIVENGGVTTATVDTSVTSVAALATATTGYYVIGGVVYKVN